RDMAEATTTQKSARRPPRFHPKRQGSSLRAHLETIKSLRSCQKTWSEISEHLKQNGISVDPSTIRRFFNRACVDSSRAAEEPKADQSIEESKPPVESVPNVEAGAGTASDRSLDVQVPSIEKARVEASGSPKGETSFKAFKQRFLKTARNFISRFRR